jgi:hypothetical protein
VVVSVSILAKISDSCPASGDIDFGFFLVIRRGFFVVIQFDFAKTASCSYTGREKYQGNRLRLQAMCGGQAF